MNQNLQNILDVIQQNEKLSEDEKKSLLKSLKDADNELMITAFKLERTEKVKKTTAILLEETIEELEQKRIAVEEQAKIIQLEHDRKTKELEEARQLQLSMLPKILPDLQHLDIAVYMKTATEVGGDYYDFNVDTDGTLTFAIGDATGHGMKAGIIVSMVKALFSSGESTPDIRTFFNQSSDTLKGIELGRLMMAFMMIKIKSNKIELANAGMPPLFIYRKQSNTVEEIMINGMPLGAMKNFPYEIREAEILSGDTLLLLSDGLPELKNEKDEQYGYDKVKTEFESIAEKSPDEIVEHLKSSASEWSNGIEPDDDVTFVVIKIK
jgi:serine phosphatase RsbU (regulator of sigma subunit)